MTLDRTLPGVYVDVEDRSLVEETNEIGRTGYFILLSDQGPHNKVVELTTRQDLYDLYARPDSLKYGQGHYLVDKHLAMGGTAYVVRPAMMEPFGNATIDDCMGIANTYIKINNINSNSTHILGNFGFINNSNIVVSDSTSISLVSVGEWIFPETQDSSVARQIIKIDTDEQELTLDNVFSGETTTDNVYTYTEFSTASFPHMRYEDDCDILDSSVIWYAYAIGPGEPYNQYYIKGVRNTIYERLYTDSDGNVLYPYLFMDIAIYRLNEDNTSTLTEGPWTVSLSHRTPTGTIIQDPYSGDELYLPTVINENSKLIRMKESVGASKLMTLKAPSYPYAPDVQARQIIQTFFTQSEALSYYSTVGQGGIYLQNGSNGNLFENDLLNYTDEYQALVAQAYNGSLTSVDGSVELILQSIYPWYLFDYVVCGGFKAMELNAAREFADTRGDVLLLADTGKASKSADIDIQLRQTDVAWNTWNAMLYTQYREIKDTQTGRKFDITPVYHALDRHLYCDATYWIAEPVAGSEKGAVSESINLKYKPNLTKLKQLVEAELNPTIVEPDGTYILTQFTTWKRLSMMKRAHVVKFIHYCKKKIPSVLKDILQRKATVYWVNQCYDRVNGFLNPFVDKGDNDRYVALSSFDLTIKFDDTRQEIMVALTLDPIGVIERITVNIQVV